MSADRQTILLAALEERYRALAAIRERVQTIALWVLGLLAGAAGWVITAESPLAPHQKIFGTVAVLVIVAVLRLGYFPDLRRGFLGQQKVAARIEDELGLYTPRALSSKGQGEATYPESWKNAGKGNNGDGRFFEANHLLIYVGVLLLLVAMWI